MFLFLTISLYVLVAERKVAGKKLITFIKDYYLALILGLILIAYFFFSNKIYLLVFKDVISFTILFITFFILTILNPGKLHLEHWIKSFSILLVVFAFIISVNELLLLFNILAHKVLYADYHIYEYLKKELQYDYNFTQVPVIFGIVILLDLMIKPQTPKRNLLYNILILTFFVSIFFSGSKRALIILIVTIILFIITQLWNYIRKGNKIKIFCQNTKFILPALLLIGLTLYSFASYVPYRSKCQVFELIGSKNVSGAFNNITANLLRYSNAMNKGITHKELFIKLFKPEYMPEDPDCGWGTRIHLTVFPLKGENVDIVPDGAKGYLMDKTCDAHTWTGNAYSFTVMGKDKVKATNILCASAFCYVSEDFNGTYTFLFAEGAITGERAVYYNLEKKGTWQKLNLELDCTDGEAFASMYFSKFDVTDFSSLKGFVIFAYPIFEIREKKKVDSISSISAIQRKTFIPGYHVSFFFHIYELNFDSGLSINVEKDPLRKFVSKFISEDTSYYAYSKNLDVDTLGRTFFESRTLRWQFSWKIFTQEYNIKQKIFGGGFDFLNWYGFYFLKDKTASDWPHNPFLSILLYSGIVGLIFYLLLLYKVFYYYIKYIKKYLIFFIFFLITFSFSFFSAGSPFDPPVMGFFIILPFFFHSIHKNDKKYHNIQ
ncbi:MAG: hypothetical protein MUF36_00085 [Bacteroidales bacterium]|jgi:hypothetical protein|nr:hypothetical protein [Bacteroidales bacterium]